MKLLRLELQHWCQHTELAVDFPPDPIIRLSGPNNAGKSNLIRAIGRVLAQGRSDFGDTSYIQHGAEQASIRLTAQTAEGVRFVISRVMKERQTRTSLEFEDQVLTGADDVQQQLQAWFGRPETLLQLFIAPQGRIASLLKERGKERLTKFIEICGFKGFLQKQAALNKFIKGYPALSDPSLVVQDVQDRIQQAEQHAAEKSEQIARLPDRVAMENESGQLQSTKTLWENHRKVFEEKQRRLKATEATVSQPLPDLRELQEKLTRQDLQVQRLRVCVRHQQVHKERASLLSAQEELLRTPEDRTDFQRLIQETSEELQVAIERRNQINAAEQAFAVTQAELNRLERIIEEHQRVVQSLNYSTAWHTVPLETLTRIQKLAFRQQTQMQSIHSLRATMAKLATIPQPSKEILRASQASEEQLQDLVHLGRHAQRAEGACPLCRQAWTEQDIAQRLGELKQKSEELRGALEQSPEAGRIYRKWSSAQAELPKLKESLQVAESALAETEERLAEQLRPVSLPEADLPRIGEIIANYHRVREALNPPSKEADTLRTKISGAKELSAQRREEAAQLVERIAQSNARLREILQRQSAAQEHHRHRARLQKQIEMVQQALCELERGLGELPADFSVQEDYAASLTKAERDMATAQGEFRKASIAWTSRFEQMKSIEVLKGEIASLTNELAALTWDDAKETRLADIRQVLEADQRLGSEANLIQQQIESLRRRLISLNVDQRKFGEQTRNVADMQAVSDFLAYDSGPQKFLQNFFREALNQTNFLLSEMGLPITLHLGTDLEILVRDRHAQESSALSLGGGYSSLIGVAFRIALQKMILPRVHTIILDEPSTHIDEQNMELLVPFFERLKDSLHSYGIDQCLIVDHHPGWNNTTVGLIHVGEQE